MVEIVLIISRKNVVGAIMGMVTYNVAILVRQGMGAALCLWLDCAYDGLTFVPISLTQQTGSALVWKKHQAHSPAVSALIAHINTAIHRK